MIDQTTLLTYLAILLGFVFIPGPAVLLTLARATRSGTRVGMATGLGIAAGDLVHTLLAVVGISAIVLASALLFAIVKYMGAAYLVYLGVKAILKRADTGLVLAAPSLNAKTAFRQAIVLEILNPKSAMFFLAFLPQFVNPTNGSVGLQLIILGLLFVLMGLLTTILVAVSAGQVSRFLQRNPLVLRWQDRVVGGIYCGLGVRLAFTEK
ncbi:LysE family translocator [uncultured Amphritea sp.]|uniref:LysE family translocator n=1 Tax=uncultured Amphritea sp. TaxID=981605 RepID=UPI0026136040|nr:LysE family translocator [uncultured Amphritea sp.]